MWVPEVRRRGDGKYELARAGTWVLLTPSVILHDVLYSFKKNVGTWTIGVQSREIASVMNLDIQQLSLLSTSTGSLLELVSAAALAHESSHLAIHDATPKDADWIQSLISDRYSLQSADRTADAEGWVTLSSLPPEERVLLEVVDEQIVKGRIRRGKVQATQAHEL